MQDFLGKVVLITAAGAGLGRELALAFASLGARVAANDLNPLGVDETVASIIKAGGKAQAYVFDIAKRMPVEGLVAQVLNDFGQIDFLINNASVKPDESLLEMDEWEFHRTLDVNLGGAFFAIQQVGRVMAQQGGGAIINLISEANEEAFRKGHSAYTTTQLGLIGLTQEASRELKGLNIRVNAIYQGSNEDFQPSPPGWNSAVYDEWKTTFTNSHQPEIPELVRRVLFLCSEAASSLTGQVIIQGL